ncbi:MAG TPA: 5-methyltetrahydropteroyltriglutamate--homocysteine S-methyltransferase, partial [Streptosporangiaceae bacterium]|nr:5-methyltetrahydropteroyltriglutamate--homocysteine S-methyltransferase [Streptosporangiaceae bacterium]
WHMDFIYQIGGVSKAPGHMAVKFTNPSGTIEWTPAALHVGSKVRMDQTIFGEDFTYLKSQVSTAVPKQTIPSPNMVHYRGGPAMLDPEVYPDIEEFWADLAAAYADEVQRLNKLGCTYLQFDDTSLAYLNDPAQRAEIAGRGEDAEHMHLRYISQINAAGDIEFTPASIRVDSKLMINDTIFADAFTFLRSHVTTAVPKLTIPSPNMVHYRGGPASVDQSVYPDMEEFWADLAAAYADEVQRLNKLGCTYLQFDDTSLAYLNDPSQRAEISERGEDAEHMHLRYIKQINDAVKDKPADMAITTHMCRGNFRSSWVASGGYDFVAEALFSELAVDGFFLEYDDERSGGFEPLRFVPKGKMVVLGLVTTKRPELESKDDLKRRIDEAAKFVPLDQICLSGQCGFSSTFEGNALTYDEQVAKLRLIVETAQEVWG